MYKVLPNGCEIVHGHGIEVGLIQTEKPDNPEAFLCWMEGQGITSAYDWRIGTRFWAIATINAWLETIGLALNEHMQIVEHA
jgi:hypothetical protein